MAQGMAIETPEDVPPFPVRATPTEVETTGSGTIAQFYQAIDVALRNPAITWYPDRNQITDDQFFAGQLFAVNNYADAHRAIEEIVSEGEGSPQTNNPLDFQNEIAHYYRFGEVYYNKVLTKTAEYPGYAWGPEPLGVDWDQVYPAIPDPCTHDFSKDSQAAQDAQAACNLAYSAMVDALQLAMNGVEGQLGVAVRAMFDLRMAAKAALHIPLADGTSVAGPSLPLRFAPHNRRLRMSVLETPRVYFAGQIAWDPITTNNYPANYDEQVTETLFSVEQDVQQFRDQAIDDVLAIGSWNPQGTHRSTFFDTEVNGVDTGGGTSTADPFVGAPVNFLGMLVDCEPYGAFSSQLYFDAINLGVDGSYRIFAPRADRVTARYINFFRYRDKASSIIAEIASVNWQTSFPKGGGLVVDALRFAGAAGARQPAPGRRRRWAGDPLERLPDGLL